MSLIQLVTRAVRKMDRNCTPAEVYEAVQDDLPQGKGREHVQKALCHAAAAGLIQHVRKGKAGGLGGSTEPGVFAPAVAVTYRRIASVFQLAQAA